MTITITNLTTRIKVVFTDATTITQYFLKGALDIWSENDAVYITDTTKIGSDGKPKIWQIPWKYVSGATSSDSVVTSIFGYDETFTPSISLGASNISAAAIITAITTEANWSTGSFVDPGGIIAAMTSGQMYIDTTNKIMYQFNGTTLVRWPINNIG
jgi:hypothetical protein